MVSVRRTDIPTWKIGICSVNTLSLLENSRKGCFWKKRTGVFEMVSLAASDDLQHKKNVWRTERTKYGIKITTRFYTSSQRATNTSFWFWTVLSIYVWNILSLDNLGPRANFLMIVALKKYFSSSDFRSAALKTLSRVLGPSLRRSRGV